MSFATLGSNFPKFQKYFHHDSASSCVKEMLKADKKGKVLIKFLSAALGNPTLIANDKIKSLVQKCFEKIKEKKKALKLSSKVTKEADKLKTTFKAHIEKGAQKIEKEEKKPPEAIVEEEIEEPAKAEEPLLPFDCPTDAQVCKKMIIKHFYDEMQKTKKELIDKKLYTAEEIADVMGSSYTAMLDLTLLHLLGNRQTKHELLELAKSAGFQGVFFNLYIQLSSFDAQLLKLTPSQRKKAEVHATYKDPKALEKEPNVFIKTTLSLIGEVRLEIEQSVLNLASGQNSSEYNFNTLFTQ